MNDFFKMDVFFVVATAAVVVLGALVGVALVRLLRILRHVERISDVVHKEAELVQGDIAGLRRGIREEGFKYISFARSLRHIVQRIFTRRKGK